MAVWRIFDPWELGLESIGSTSNWSQARPGTFISATSLRRQARTLLLARNPVHPPPLDSERCVARAAFRRPLLEDPENRAATTGNPQSTNRSRLQSVGWEQRPLPVVRRRAEYASPRAGFRSARRPTTRSFRRRRERPTKTSPRTRGSRCVRLFRSHPSNLSACCSDASRRSSG